LDLGGDMAANLVTLPEELTVYHVQQIASGLIASIAAGEALQIDLSEVCRIDTAGLQLLIVLYREARRAGTQLEFLNPTSVVSETAGFCGLDEVLSTHAAPLH
jgi:anti-anti-sigma factor